MNNFKKLDIITVIVICFLFSCQETKPKLGIVPQKYANGIYSNLTDKDIEIKIDEYNHILDSIDAKKLNVEEEIYDVEINISGYTVLLEKTGLPPFYEENNLKLSEIQAKEKLIKSLEEWLNTHEKDYLNNEIIILRDKIRLTENYQEELKNSKDIHRLIPKIQIDFRSEISNNIVQEKELKKELVDLYLKYKKQLDELIEKRNSIISEKERKIESLKTEIASIQSKLVNLDSIEKVYRDNITNQQLIKSDYDSIYQFQKCQYDTFASILLSYDIEYYIRKSDKRGLQIKEFSEKINDLIQLQHKFIEYLSQTDEKTTEFRWDQIRKQLTDIENLFDRYEKLKDRVTSLFRGGMFSKYFGMSEEEIAANDLEVHASIETYKIMVPLIINFLEAYPEYNIYIDGHADRTPWIGDKYGNIKLSRNRAEIAKQRFVNSGISSNRIITDWFGEFHNTKKISLDSKDPQQVADRRVDLRIIGGESDSTVQKTNYIKFKNKFLIIVGSETKLFRHQEGFWIEHGFEEDTSPEKQIMYEDASYKNLLKESKTARQVLTRHPSPLYPSGEIELGNQVKLMLPINGEKHRIIIASMQDVVEKQITQK